MISKWETLTLTFYLTKLLTTSLQIIFNLVQKLQLLNHGLLNETYLEVFILYIVNYKFLHQ